jgi:hypothetical protein
MAYRKVLLHHRVKQQGANHQTVMSGQHPAVPAPMLLPLAQVTVNPVDDNYVTLAMQELAPITTADGAMVPATSPGKWDQLALAGGGRHG